jgi:uncharacterized protein
MDKYFNTLIVKFASPCNLNCTYCYEYNTGDDSWKKKPKFFSPELAKSLNLRIKEYLKVSSLTKINIIAHGGEPLLLGPKKIDYILSLIIDGIEDRINLGMQTNAVLVNQEIIEVLLKYKVKCGVSIDGNFFHNRHRIFHNGKSSYEDTLKGYHLLESNNLVAGILCVVDFDVDPREVLESLCALNPKQLDLLQPFFNHDYPLGAENLGNKFYNWFGKAFDYYMSKEEWHGIQIKIFESIIYSCLSDKFNSDWFGGPHGNYLVIESDGNYDILDHLKSIGTYGKHISNLCMGLEDFPLSVANEQIFATYKKFNIKSPPDPCIECEYQNKCGGGYYPTRYSSKNNSLNNTSAYCVGLKELFNHVSKLTENI